MKKVVIDISKAVLLIGLWFASIYFAAEVWLPTWWAINCGFINALLGIVALFWVTRTEEGAKMFYDGPGEKEGWFIIAVMWSIPGSIIFAGILWWILRFVLQLLGWWRL